MAEHQSHPLWIECDDGLEEIDPRKLITGKEDFLQEVVRWGNTKFDELNDNEIGEFEKVGIYIVKKIKDSLGDSFQIFFRSMVLDEESSDLDSMLETIQTKKDPGSKSEP